MKTSVTSVNDIAIELAGMTVGELMLMAAGYRKAVGAMQAIAFEARARVLAEKLPCQCGCGQCARAKLGLEYTSKVLADCVEKLTADFGTP